MKRYSILLVLAIVCGIALETVAQAQPVTVKVQREAMSPRRIGTYPAGTFPVSTGLRVIPKGMKAYLSATTTGVITAYNWEFVEKPAGSAAAIDTATNRFVRFVPDMVGKYIVKVTVDSGKTAFDTLFASTYAGLPQTAACVCHAGMTPNLIPDFKKTRHFTMYARGITGQLEVEEYMGKTVGVYSKSCIKCHTTGWDETVDNGNYGFEAKKAGWDTTWYKLGAFVNNEYFLPYGDSTQFRLMQASYPSVALVAQIGCEQCHGPAKDHGQTGDKTMIGKSFEAGTCMQCHDAPNKHRLGSYWLESAHSTMKLSAGEANRTQCWPCHSGSAMPAYLENRTTPNYSKTPVVASINCVTCHDPHSDANEMQLRTAVLDKLNNGFIPPAGAGGKSALCMNCHRARTDVKERVAAVQRALYDRFYPHYSPQADMWFGQNGWEYGLPITGLQTHGHLEDGCVTCHMTTRVNGSSIHSDHAMHMVDPVTQKENTTACKTCHGEHVEEFDEVRAFNDYDGNGKIEGIVTEITGLLDRLKAVLPINPTTGDVCNNMKADSAIVKTHPQWPAIVPAIWNYYLVKNDFSNGIHNTKYAVAILRASLGTLTGVESANQDVPTSYALSQNYPNPFNPTTSIQFSVPRAGNTTLYVYNSTGELVAKLADGMIAPGNYTVTWNGLDLKGVAASSGVYFYKLTVADNGNQLFSTTKKMMLVK